MSMTIRNKNVISITVKRSDYETKTPEYPGNHRNQDSIYANQKSNAEKFATGSWIIEEDYAAVAEISSPL